MFNPLSANPSKWSNTLKQFVGNSCFSVFAHFVGLALEGVRYYGAETVLVEIEHTLNYCPRTYMSEQNFPESLTLDHLLHGRGINRNNSDINLTIELSETNDIQKQLSNLQQIKSHINKRFYNEYILALCEQHQYDSKSFSCSKSIHW